MVRKSLDVANLQSSGHLSAIIRRSVTLQALESVDALETSWADSTCSTHLKNYARQIGSSPQSEE